MHTRPLATALLATLLAATLSAAPARACGEGQFNMGQGLRYQAYLAPVPASVLLYAPAGSVASERAALSRGLQQAGHRVTVVTEGASLPSTVADGGFDVVIADLSELESLGTALPAARKPALIPVVARAARRDARLRDHYAIHLLADASLGQALRAINRSMQARVQ